MTLPDARKILGLSPDEDPRPHLADFKQAREHIAAMVRTAPNETLADRYQDGLIEFDQALAAVQEHLEAAGLAAPPLPSSVAEEIPPPPARRAAFYFAWLAVLLTGIGGGAWIYLKNEEAKEQQRQARIEFLANQGSIMVENRRWQDATTTFAEIETIDPSSDLAKRGRRSIEVGMVEEQTQFIGYWTGQATAELEAGRLDEATAAARQVLAKFPAEKDAISLLEQVTAARAHQSRSAAIASARQALDQRRWDDAIATAQAILAKTPDDPDAKSIYADATAAVAKIAADQTKAAELLQMAVARDQGQFDQQALDWLREANSLTPGNPEIAARLEKLSSYTRTFHVPGDFATPAEALASARDRDRIVLGIATWKGPLVINAAVELQGTGFAETIVECAPENGSAISIGPDAKGARISGITFRHESFAAGSDRFSAALVRGGQTTFVDCRFTDASGHGLAVIEGGKVIVSRSRFASNGWNGVSATGQGCTLEVRDCESLENFEHGIESWDGAAVTLINNRCEGNSRNGIHADNGAASTIIEGNQLIANREFGLVLDSAGDGKISGNTARANLLGGMVIRAAAAGAPVTSNQATHNLGPGLILERGLPTASYTDNSISQNHGQQTLTDIDLAPAENPAAAPEEAPHAPVITEPEPAKPR